MPRKMVGRVCSFTEDTPVLMCDGSLRAIQEVEEGEWVLARNEATGEVSCRQVVAPYDNPGRSIILVTLEATDGHIEVIETTDNHPFYAYGRGWTRE
ncbi:MAG: polymorphic toxin-type HINT domain-containing protein [bacterium]